jgi:hypothetical protein
MSTPVQLATIDSTGVKIVAALLFPSGKVAGAASTVSGGTVPGTTTIGAGATAIYFGLTETPAGSGQDTKLTQIHEAMPFIGNVVPA